MISSSLFGKENSSLYIRMLVVMSKRHVYMTEHTYMYDVTLSIYAIVSHKSDHIRLAREKK
jgi:hypothetical protein